MAPAAESPESPERPRRRSERQFVANAAAAAAVGDRPPAKALRRRSKMDPSVKPLLFWTPEEVAHLVAAWRHTIAHPPARPRKTAGGFNVRMYARFVELAGGSTQRAKASMIAKKQLLHKSFEFIYEYGEKRRAGGGANHWFELSRAQRKVLGEKAMLTDQRTYALLCMDQTTYESMLEISMFEGELSIRSPWTEEEMDLLLRVWREAVSKPGRGKLPKKSSVNTRIFHVMQTLGDGASKRTKQGLVLKKESMRSSHDLIAQYNKECREARERERARSSGGAVLKAIPATWFNLTAREQERVVARKFTKTGFVYLTEPQFREVGFLKKETDRLNSVTGARQGAMWTYEENVLLVQAWREILDHPIAELQPNVILGTCIFERFVELTGGAFNRTERSTIVKLIALENMHKFVDDYNKTVALETKRNWFALSRPERKRIHFNATKADSPTEHRSNTFSDIDKSTFDSVTEILARNRSVEEIANEMDVPEKREQQSKRKQVSSDDDDDDEDDEDDSEDEDDSDEDKDGDEEDAEDKRKVSSKVKESSSSGDDDTESENELIRWKPRAVAPNKKQPLLKPEAGRGGKRAAKAVPTSGGNATHQTAASSPRKEQRATTPQTNSFLQPSATQHSLRSATSSASRAIVDHRSIFGDDTPNNSSDDSTSSSDDDNNDDDGDGFVKSSNSSEHSETNGSASKEKHPPSKQSSASPLFSLHELADLATRVNDPGESGDPEGDAGVHEGAVTPAPDVQQPVPTASESPSRSRLSPEVAAIVQILHSQSEQLIRAMGEIRDEMKCDREERKKFRRELQQDREQRRRSNNGEDNGGSDGSASEPSRKRARSRSEDPSAKKKASRRLSVQRDGFVVRL